MDGAASLSARASSQRPGAATGQTRSWWNRDWILGLILIAGTVIAYQPVWHAGFMWDDDAHLTENPCIVGTLGFKGIWTSSAAVYYPLVLTTFWVEHALWGLNPVPYHVVNVLMHSACAVLLWRVLRNLRIRGAWLGAALWAWHPVQVETVSWITELKNTQSCLFYLLAIFFFLKWLAAGKTEMAGRRRWDYPLVLLCAAMAILSKSSTVMLPVVLGLCAWWMEGRWRWRNAVWLAPFFLVSLAAGGWTIWEQKFHSGAVGQEWTQTGMERLVIAGRDVWFYLGKLFWPHPLIFIYPRWTINVSGPASFLPGIAAAAGLLVLWLKRNGILRPVFFAAAYFVVSLFPVLGFFNVYFFRFSFVGDHLQYLATMGPLVLAGAGMTALFDFGRQRRPWLGAAVCAGLLLTLATLTWRQARVYQSDESLWLDTLRLNPGCWMACNNLGLDYFKQGRFDEAIAQYHDALAIKQDFADARNNLGNVYLQQRRLDDAIAQYQKALAIQPDDAKTRNNLGSVLFQQGRLDDAITQYQKALAIHPDFADAENNFGSALLQQRRPDEAIAHFRNALAIQPDFVEASYNLGLAYSQQDRLDDAIAQYLKALNLQPDYAKVRNNLGLAYSQQGRLDEAIAQYQKALAVQPDYVEVQNNLAWLLATCPQAALRNGGKAVELAQRANQITGGGNAVILCTLAAACAEAGRFPEAAATAQRALQLARSQSNQPLADELQMQINLYQAGIPYHSP